MSFDSWCLVQFDTIRQRLTAGREAFLRKQFAHDARAHWDAQLASSLQRDIRDGRVEA